MIRWLALVACLLPEVGRAEPPEADAERRARELFEEGRRLLESGVPATACPLFEESRRLFPAAGTLLNLALCYERIGRTASAWQGFGEALEAARRSDDAGKLGVAQKHLDALAPRVPRLTVVLPSGVAAAAIDGVEFDAAGLTDRAVDPGEHLIVAGEWRQLVYVEDGQARQVEVPAPAPEPAPPARAALPAPPPEAPAPETTALGTRKTLALAVAGAGGMALAAGTVYGLRARSRWNQHERYCDDTGCDPPGLRLADEARRAGNVSTVLFLVGAAAVTGGAVLWLTDVQPAVGPGHASLIVSGRF